jgi:hypothetical protein
MPRFLPGPVVELLTGKRYENARALANLENARIRKLYNLVGAWIEINEMVPVKWGGSPTSWANKELLTPPAHWDHSAYWRRVERSLFDF